MKKQVLLSIAFLTSLVISACSANLAEEEKIPYVFMNNVQKDISNPKFPQVSLNYCIINPIDSEVDITKVEFLLEVENIKIQQKFVNFNDSIEPLSKKCYDLKFKTDALLSPKAASTLLESILPKKYAITATLGFDDDEVTSKTSKITGVFN